MATCHWQKCITVFPWRCRCFSSIGLLEQNFISVGNRVCSRETSSPWFSFLLNKGQMAWFSEKQRLPVKTSGNACFLRWEASLWEVLRPTRERLRNICAHWCQSRWKGWVCCCSTFNSQKRNWGRSCLKSLLAYLFYLSVVLYCVGDCPNCQHTQTTFSFSFHSFA